MTLLELLLSLALSIMVFSAITVAIQTHLSGLTQQQIKIERKQIARAALAIIANDCRAALQYKAADYSGLDNLMKSQEMMMNNAMTEMAGETTTDSDTPPEGEDAEQGDGESEGTGTGSNAASPGSGAGSGSANSGSPTAASPDETEEPESLYDEEAVSFRPMLIGSNDALMMDISRIPRLDQYSPLIASAASLAQSPSDIKSVAFFFSDSNAGVKSEIQFETAAQGGLYRREIDRAVAAFSGEPRTMTSPDNFSKLISPEIAEVAFRYFDGSDWQTSWNSEDSGGFPTAIEITIVIDPARTAKNNLTYAYRGFDALTMETSRTVVHLPLTEPKAEEE
jgi:hypothetical protein